MNDAARIFLDDAARAAALRRLGLPVVRSERRYVRLRPGETTVVAFTVFADDGRSADAYVRLPEGPEAASSTRETAEKWSRLMPAAAPPPFGDGVRVLDGDAGVLFFFPNDAVLRGLKDVVDLDRLKRVVGDLPPFKGRLRIKADGAEFAVLRWKPEHRLVASFRAKTRDAEGRAGPTLDAIVRVFADDRGRRLFRLAAELASAAEPPPIPYAIGAADEGRLFVEARVPGRPLRELLLSGEDGAPAACADAIAKVHAVTPRTPLPSFDLAAEAAAAAQSVATWLPASAACAGRIADAVRARAPRGPAPASLLHGDLHQGQFLIAGDGVRIVDFERAGTGDPLADIGNFAAELLAFADEEPAAKTAAHRFLQRFLEAHSALPGRYDSAALPAYVAVALLRRSTLALRRAAPDAEIRARRHLELAASALGIAFDDASTAATTAAITATTATTATTVPSSSATAATTSPGTAAPTSKASAADHGPIVAVYARPGDADRWPCLFESADPERRYGLFDIATGRVTVVSPAMDAALPNLAAFAAAGELLARRVGKRAALRFRRSDTFEFVKVLPRAKAARTAAAQDAALQSVHGAGDPDLPRFAALERVDLDQGAVWYEGLAGESLRDRLRRPDDVDADLVRAARALAAWQRRPVRLPRLVGGSEAPLSAWCDLAVVVAPRLGFAPDDDSRTEAFRACLATLPVMAPLTTETLVHGDLHDGNILLTPSGRVGLIDLDMLHHGDPARDPGNLAAHIVLRAAEAGLSPDIGFSRAKTFLAAFAQAGGSAPGPATATASASAVGVSAAHAAFRLACLYSFRRGGHAYAPTLFAAARAFAAGSTS